MIVNEYEAIHTNTDGNADLYFFYYLLLSD